MSLAIGSPVGCEGPGSAYFDGLAPCWAILQRTGHVRNQSSRALGSSRERDTAAPVRRLDDLARAMLVEALGRHGSWSAARPGRDSAVHGAGGHGPDLVLFEGAHPICGVRVDADPIARGAPGEPGRDDDPGFAVDLGDLAGHRAWMVRHRLPLVHVQVRLDQARAISALHVFQVLAHAPERARRARHPHHPGEWRVRVPSSEGHQVGRVLGLSDERPYHGRGRRLAGAASPGGALEIDGDAMREAIWPHRPQVPTTRLAAPGVVPSDRPRGGVPRGAGP